MRTLALAVALVLALPIALAHVEQYSQYKSLTVGPYSVFLEPRPTPVFAGTPMSFVAQVADAGTGALLPRVPTSIVVGGPDFSERKSMQPDGTGYQVASMTLPSRGNYSVRVLVRDEATNETYGNDTEFEVFPDIPYRIRPVDQMADMLVGQRTTLAFDVVDPITLQPKPIADLKVRLEHWSEDHVTFLGATDETPQQVGTGAWRITPTVQEKGMYHIRFASDAGGFNYDDVPLLHIYATEVYDPEAGENGSPSAGAVAAVLALGVVALLLRRR